MSESIEEGIPDKPSKTQRKRDMQAFREAAEKLVEMSAENLATLDAPDVINAVSQCRRITKGNARKRQIQHIAKLLRKTDFEPIRDLIDKLDSSSETHLRQFHNLERWREGLIAQNSAVFEQIVSEFPDVDRQQLRNLVRLAIAERERDDGSLAHFRKLFKFLRTSTEG
jgi:ribosome-associated protein